MAQLDEWVEAKAQMSYWKDKEIVLRNQILGRHQDNLKLQGVTRIQEAGTWLKVTSRANMKPDPERYPKVGSDIIIDEYGPGDVCVSYVPKVNTTLYKQLPEAERLQADKYLILTPGQGSISLIDEGK